MAKSTVAGQPAITRAGCYDKGASNELLAAVCCGAFTALTGSADVLPFPGNIALNYNGVDATTLATPTAGIDDGKTIVIIDTGGHAHTITTASNKISPSHSVATFGGTAGSIVEFMAYNGVWYPVGTSLGVTFA